MREKLIILGASRLQKPAYQRAKKIGCEIIAVDQNLKAECFKYADYKIYESFKNYKKILSQLKKLKLTPSGIITCGVEASIYVSLIAGKFNLNSITLRSSINSSNKYYKSQILKKNKINIPDFYCTKNFIRKFKYPFVIKPTDSSGSRGVKFIKNKKVFFKEFFATKSISSDSKVFIERYIKGREYSLEGFMLNSKLYNTGFARRYYLPLSKTNPDFVEIEGVMPPTDLTEKIYNQFVKIFEKASLALGITNGPVKSDMIIDKNKRIYILEIASRSSSSFAAETQLYSNGTDCISANILWSLKKNFSIKKYLVPKHKNFVSHCYYKHISGKIKNLNINILKKNKNIKTIKFTRPAFIGQHVKKINFLNRLFYIIYVSKKKNIRKKTKKLLSKINFFI